MMPPRRWDPCIAHRGSDATSFIEGFFRDEHRKVLLVAGAGFDPRSARGCIALADVAASRVVGAFIREQRPNPDPELLRRAEGNSAKMQSLVSSSREVPIEVFSLDGAVIGGRAATIAMGQFPLADFTDVIVD